MISYLPMELQVSMVGGFMCTMTFVTSIGAVAYCAYHTLVGTYADIPVVSEAGEGLAHAAECDACARACARARARARVHRAGAWPAARYGGLCFI